MTRFEIREKDGSQLVRDTETDVYYLPLDTYAKQVGQEVHDLIPEIRYILESYHKDDQDFDQIIDLGSSPLKGVSSRYLIPANLVFVWMLSHCRNKALEIGCCAMTEAIKFQFASIGESIFKIGDLVRLKDGAERVEVNDFDSLSQAFYFAPGDVANVFTVNSPRLRQKKGFPDTQTVVQFKKMNYAGVEMELIARVETKELIKAD